MNFRSENWISTSLPSSSMRKPSTDNGRALSEFAGSGSEHPSAIGWGGVEDVRRVLLGFDDVLDTGVDGMRVTRIRNFGSFTA